MDLAAPNTLFLKWFDAWTRRALRQAFHRVHLYLDEPLPFDANQSHLYIANHSSFWDGIVLYHWLRTRRRQPIYCMIDAVQVKEHPFFRRVGGFSIDRTSPRDGMRAIDYAAKLLNDSPASVIVFAQGGIRHNDLRRLGFEAGVARIIQNAPAAKIIAVALRYEFWEEQRAEAMIKAASASVDRGKNHRIDRRRIVQTLEETIVHFLDRLKCGAMRYEPGEINLKGKPSISKWKRNIGGGKE
jgi:hypothetical protein